MGNMADFTKLSRADVVPMDEFHRHLAAARRDAQENLPHPARTQPAEKPVAADLYRVTRPKIIHPHPESV